MRNGQPDAPAATVVRLTSARGGLYAGRNCYARVKTRLYGWLALVAALQGSAARRDAAQAR